MHRRRLLYLVLIQVHLSERYFRSSGQLTFETMPSFSGKKITLANFSVFNKPGNYCVFIPSVGNFYFFSIKSSAHEDAAMATLKAFYFQRASIDLKETYAGKWERVLDL